MFHRQNAERVTIARQAQHRTGGDHKAARLREGACVNKHAPGLCTLRCRVSVVPTRRGRLQELATCGVAACNVHGKASGHRRADASRPVCCAAAPPKLAETMPSTRSLNLGESSICTVTPTVPTQTERPPCTLRGLPPIAAAWNGCLRHAGHPASAVAATIAVVQGARRCVSHHPVAKQATNKQPTSKQPTSNQQATDKQATSKQQATQVSAPSRPYGKGC